MIECNKCQEYGIRFKRNYNPSQFIEGKLSSRIWLIGLNPAKERDWVDERNLIDLSDHFYNWPNLHQYFKDFKNVSREIFDKFGKEEGTAHTDLVKCSSKKWPPNGVNRKDLRKIINNCSNYLINQIELHHPQVIICNGAPVSTFIKEFLKPIKDFDTYYISRIGDNKVYVVLTGFIGRIDNYSKKRLGSEIESILKKL